MRALVFADRPPRARVADLVDRHRPDVVLTLGDLSYGDLQGLEHVALPKLGVHGNHCLPGYFEALGVVDLHLKVVVLDGLSFGGFEGSLRYKDGPYQYSQAEAETLLSGFPFVDVFVSHSPPRGVNDHDSPPHLGFEALAAYVDRHKPRLLLHGHTYPLEEDLVSRVGSTEIVYVNGFAVVELPEAP